METLREALLETNDNQTVLRTEGNECHAEWMPYSTDFLTRSELCAAVEVEDPVMTSETNAEMFKLDHVLALLSLPSPGRFRVC